MAKLVVTNNKREQITTGKLYFVEFYDGTNWKNLKFFDDMVFTDIGYEIKPSNSKEFIVDLNPVSYNYAPGRYRVGKVAYASTKKATITTELTVE